MEQFEFKVVVTYKTTWIVEANSLAEAEEKAQEGLYIDSGMHTAEIVDWKILK